MIYKQIRPFSPLWKQALKHWYYPTSIIWVSDNPISTINRPDYKRLSNTLINISRVVYFASQCHKEIDTAYTHQSESIYLEYAARKLCPIPYPLLIDVLHNADTQKLIDLYNEYYQYQIYGSELLPIDRLTPDNTLYTTKQSALDLYNVFTLQHKQALLDNDQVIEGMRVSPFSTRRKQLKR